MQSTLDAFQETQSPDAFTLQNSKLLKVSLDQITIQAKLGSMVAYQGDVRFEHAGSGGMGRLLKKAVTGEGTRLMKGEGTGEVFLADQAQITWSSGVQTQVKVDANLKTLVGRGSGETVQMAFTGEGWVLVQPSEGQVQSSAAGGSGAGGGIGKMLGNLGS